MPPRPDGGLGAAAAGPRAPGAPPAAVRGASARSGASEVNLFAWTRGQTGDLEQMSQARQKIAAFLRSRLFLFVLVTAVFGNVAVIVLDADASAAGRPSPFPPAVSLSFLVFYTIELLARVYVDRAQFLLSCWNILDTTIVITGMLEVLAIYGVSNMRALQMLAFLRIARTARVLALLPTRLVIVRGLRGCIVATVWGVVLITIVLLIFAVLSIQFAGSVNPAEDGYCSQIFESVFDAMVFFFRVSVLGDGWECVVPFIDQGWAWQLF
ncbi:unnamed protein product [Prorocentrum cordatum]|uniref:Ion transport domain-containing protein n=1 Tax=Prorocentrum cordatum TaxID=2364126 RepID=A0ABN9XWP1_9DINO|nr:unnamed protein product [Polarella glacialis]